jgi:phosphoglycolate phosphatase-like HAD superfamily hydrolase
MNGRARIFDVDGAGADPGECHRQVFNAAFASHGLPWHWGGADMALEDLTRAGGLGRICAAHLRWRRSCLEAV